MQTSSQGGVFAMTEPCRDCLGRGLIVDDPCPVCHGSGRGISTRTIQARIPAGVKDGQRIRLRGKGAPGERGGPDGDLYVVVHVSAAPALRPQGRQPHPRGAGPLRRGGARRRDLGPDARAARRSRSRSRPARPTAAPSGSRAGVRRAATAPRATCSSPSRSRRRASSTRRPGPPSRRCATRRRARPAGDAAEPRQVPCHGADHAITLRRQQPRRAGLRDQRRRRADRHAPADPARLRPARPGQPGPRRRRRAALLAARHRDCSATVAELTSSGIGIEGVRRILDLEDRGRRACAPGSPSSRPSSRRGPQAGAAQPAGPPAGATSRRTTRRRRPGSPALTTRQVERNGSTLR